MAILVEARSVSPVAVPDSLPNDNFRRVLSVQDHHRILDVKVLDELIIFNEGGTVHVRQFLSGQHDSPLAANWKKHIGWQGKESIREVYRFKQEFGGVEELIERELDVSKREYIFS